MCNWYQSISPFYLSATKLFEEGCLLLWRGSFGEIPSNNRHCQAIVIVHFFYLHLMVISFVRTHYGDLSRTHCHFTPTIVLRQGQHLSHCWAWIPQLNREWCFGRETFLSKWKWTLISSWCWSVLIAHCQLLASAALALLQEGLLPSQSVVCPWS